jgi:hypothetical protein
MSKLTYYLYQKPKGIILQKLNKELVDEFPREAVKFAKDYFKNKDIDAVEIGVLTGRNSEDILKRLNINKIYLIDPYVEYESINDNKLFWVSKKRATRDFFLAKRRLRNYKNKIVWIKKYSDKAIKDIPIVDFVYIDGNHKYKFVKKDVFLYWEKVKSGGILSGHDIDVFDVRKAVFELIKDKKINVDNFYLGEKRDWWIVKE